MEQIQAETKETNLFQSPTVKPILKYLTMALFIILPFVGFYLGMQYQKQTTANITVDNNLPNEQQTPNPSSDNTTNSQTDVNENNEVSSSTKASIVLPADWEKAGFGSISFSYPKSWHVVFDTDDNNLIRDKIFIGSKPFYTRTTHGPTSELIIGVQLGFQNPQEKLNELIVSEKNGLKDIEEEELSSQYFEKIYHVKGKDSGGGYSGGMSVEKYFLLSQNPQYVDINNPINTTIVIFEINQEIESPDQTTKDIIEKIVLSTKECHYSSCENQ